MAAHAWTTPLRAFWGVLFSFMGASALLGVLALMFGGRESFFESHPIIVFGALVWVPACLITGLALLRRAHWARYSAVICSAFLPFVGIVQLFESSDWWSFTLQGLVAAALVTLSFHNKAMREHFDEALEAPPLKTRLIRIGVMVGVILMLVAANFAIPAIELDLTRSHHRSNCESGDAVACGKLATSYLLRARTIDEAQKGFDDLTALCEGGDLIACETVALAQSREFLWTIQEGAEVLVNHSKTRVIAACEADEDHACFIAARTAKILEEEQKLVVRRGANRACRAGDGFACHVLAAMIDPETSDGDEWVTALRLACDAGFAMDCRRLSHEVTGDASDTALWRAYTLGDVEAAKILHEAKKLTNDDITRLCWDGNGIFCEDIVVPDTPHAPVLTTIYANMTQVLSDHPGNLGLLRIAPDDQPLAVACEDDIAPACAALGAQLAESEASEWRPRLPLVESLASTYGRACELGMNAACVAIAFHLLNRPVGESRDVARANVALEKACKRGHPLACWSQDFGAEIIAGDLSKVVEQAKVACKVSTATQAKSPCAVLTGIWAAEIDVLPWAISDRVAEPKLREICSNGRKSAPCAQLAHFYRDASSARLDETARPYYISRYDAAAVGCGVGIWWACEDLLTTSQAYPRVDQEKWKALKTQVCDISSFIDSCE